MDWDAYAKATMIRHALRAVVDASIPEEEAIDWAVSKLKQIEFGFASEHKFRLAFSARMAWQEIRAASSLPSLIETYSHSLKAAEHEHVDPLSNRGRTGVTWLPVEVETQQKFKMEGD